MCSLSKSCLRIATYGDGSQCRFSYRKYRAPNRQRQTEHTWDVIMPQGLMKNSQNKSLREKRFLPDEAQFCLMYCTGYFIINILFPLTKLTRIMFLLMCKSLITLSDYPMFSLLARNSEVIARFVSFQSPIDSIILQQLLMRRRAKI